MAEIPQDLTVLSDEDLAVLDQQVADERSALAEAQRPILAEKERRQVEAEARARLAGMTTSERAALFQALTVDGVEAPEEIAPTDTPIADEVAAEIPVDAPADVPADAPVEG